MSPRLAVFAFSLIAGAASAYAQSDKEKEERLLAAIAACDKGAAAPLDATATEPPIQFSELFGAARRARKAPRRGRRVQARSRGKARREAALAPAVPGRDRPRRPVRSGTDRARPVACERGMPEANFLLFVIHRSYAEAGLTSPRVRRRSARRRKPATVQPSRRSSRNTATARFSAVTRERRRVSRGCWPNCQSRASDRPTRRQRGNVRGRARSKRLPLMSDAFSPEEAAARLQRDP